MAHFLLSLGNHLISIRNKQEDINFVIYIFDISDELSKQKLMLGIKKYSDLSDKYNIPISYELSLMERECTEVREVFYNDIEVLKRKWVENYDKS